MTLTAAFYETFVLAFNITMTLELTFSRPQVIKVLEDTNFFPSLKIIKEH